MTLYEITDEIRTLEELIDQALHSEDGSPRELTPEEKETLSGYVDEMAGKFSDKAERICRFMREQETLAEACKAEEDRLGKLRKTRERKALVLKNLVQFAMERVGMEKADAGVFKLAIQKNPPSVLIDNESAIPANFMREVPATYCPDKKLLAEALKDGQDVPGARLVQTKGLRVK